MKKSIKVGHNKKIFFIFLSVCLFPSFLLALTLENNTETENGAPLPGSVVFELQTPDGYRLYRTRELHSGEIDNVNISALLEERKHEGIEEELQILAFHLAPDNFTVFPDVLVLNFKDGHRISFEIVYNGEHPKPIIVLKK